MNGRPKHSFVISCETLEDCRKAPLRKPASCAWFRSECHGGLTLFEVILSLAILGVAVAVIAQAAWSGLENARMARELVQAELLAENVMAELLAGIRPLESVEDSTFEEDDSLEDPQQWLYSIEVATTETEGMLQANVTVRANNDRPRKVSYSLVRWILDEDAIVVDEEQTSQSEGQGAEESR